MCSTLRDPHPGLANENVRCSFVAPPDLLSSSKTGLSEDCKRLEECEFPRESYPNRKITRKRTARVLYFLAFMQPAKRQEIYNEMHAAVRTAVCSVDLSDVEQQHRLKNLRSYYVDLVVARVYDTILGCRYYSKITNTVEKISREACPESVKVTTFGREGSVPKVLLAKKVQDIISQSAERLLERHDFFQLATKPSRFLEEYTATWKEHHEKLGGTSECLQEDLLLFRATLLLMPPEDGWRPGFSPPLWARKLVSHGEL